MTTSIDRASLVLSANRALWGEISAAVRAVYIREIDNEVQLRFIMDGPISEEDKESISCVGAEVIASFPEHRISESAVRLDPPAPIHVPEGWHLVFLRRE